MRHLTYRPANGFKRVIAYLIDTIPLQMALYLVSHAGFGISPMADPLALPEIQQKAYLARGIIGGGTLVIWILYSIIGELSPLRGTLGKRAMGLQVRAIHGKLTFGRIVLRNFAKILSAIPCYLGFIAAFFTFGNRTWHDMMSGTAVAERK